MVVEDLTPPEHREVLIPRMRLHYLDWGGPRHPTVVLLHGGGLNAHTWDLCALALRTRWHVIAPDLRGHGDSEWSPEVDYRIETLAEDLVGLLERTGIAEFVLVGMSMGGLTSLRLAIDGHPGLRGLVLVDISPSIRVEGARQVQRFMQDTHEFGSIDELIDRAVEFNDRRSREFLRRSLLNNLRQRPDGRWVWKYDARHHTTVDLDRLTYQHARMWDHVDDVRVPTLVVRGNRSRVLDRAAFEGLLKAIPNAEGVEVDAGHTVQGDNPKALVEAVAAFLDTAVAPGRDGTGSQIFNKGE